MHRRRTIAAAVSVLAAGGLAVAHEQTASASPTPISHLTAAPAGYHEVDNAPEGASSGDESMDRFRLFRHGSRVGTLIQHCVLVDVRHELAQCGGSLLLRSGRLVIGGPTDGSTVTTEAVLGGTRHYAGVGGSVVFTPHGKTVRVDLHLRGDR